MYELTFFRGGTYVTETVHASAVQSVATLYRFNGWTCTKVYWSGGRHQAA